MKTELKYQTINGERLVIDLSTLSSILPPTALNGDSPRAHLNAFRKTINMNPLEPHATTLMFMDRWVTVTYGHQIGIHFRPWLTWEINILPAGYHILANILSVLL